MILMGVSQDRAADGRFSEILKHRSRVQADMLGVHSAIQKHRPLGKIKPVTVGADAGPPSEIGESHDESG